MSKWLSVGLVALYALLLIPNLGARPLWQDEAETALVARQMVSSNIWLPYAYDDDGPISQDWNYQFSVSPLWRWHPWLQFYVAALSFRILGISTFTARLPFVLVGMASFAYFLHFIVKYGPPRRNFKIIAVTLFLTSVPLLLHIRQSRYYALSLFFYLMTIDGYLQLTKQQFSWRYLLGSIGLFHSFLPGALTLQASFFLYALFTTFIRQTTKPKFLRVLFIFFSISLLFTLPWAIWLKIGGQNLNFSFELIRQHLWQHYLYIHKFIFPFVVFIPLFSKNLRSRFFRNDILLLFSITISISILLYTFNHPYFFRYLVPLIPIFIYIGAWFVVNSKPVVSVIIIVFLFSAASRGILPYYTEITRPYLGANRQIINFLQTLNPQIYRSLAVNYDDFTFRFHTRFRVFGPQQLTQLPECPQVIIIFPNWGNEQLLSDIAASCHLQASSITVPYVKLADDPDPLNHQFTPPPPRKLPVFLAPPAAS